MKKSIIILIAITLFSVAYNIVQSIEISEMKVSLSDMYDTNQMCNEANDILKEQIDKCCEPRTFM